MRSRLGYENVAEVVNVFLAFEYLLGVLWVVSFSESGIDRFKTCRISISRIVVAGCEGV